MLGHAGAADESLAVAMLLGAAWIGWIGVTRLRERGFPRVPRPAAVGMIVVSVGLVGAAAVVPRALLGPKTVVSGPRLASTATLAFVAPEDDATVTNDELQVRLDLEGGTVINATGPVAPDTGHIHLSVDGTLVSMTYGTFQVLDLRPYGPGEHTIHAEFVAADHQSFAPPVVADVTIRRTAA
jgi:hypothetical protein